MDEDKTSQASILARQQQILEATAATLAQNVGQLHKAVNEALVVRDELIELNKGNQTNRFLAIAALIGVSVCITLIIILFVLVR